MRPVIGKPDARHGLLRSGVDALPEAKIAPWPLAGLALIPEDAEEASSVLRRPNERTELLGRAVALLRSEVTEPTWQAFWQTAVQGRSAREVGDALGMSAGAVYVARSRVLARLKEEVQRLQEAE